jgi:nucleoside-diphosphate-sugar epimerase
MEIATAVKFVKGNKDEPTKGGTKGARESKMRQTKLQRRSDALKPYAVELDLIAAKSKWGRMADGPRGGLHYRNIASGTAHILYACQAAGCKNIVGISYWSGSNPTPSTAISADVYNRVAEILGPLYLL